LGIKSGIAYSYNNIGIVYYEQENYSEALKNYTASLKIKEELGDKSGIADSYCNIGNMNIKLKKAKTQALGIYLVPGEEGLLRKEPN